MCTGFTDVNDGKARPGPHTCVQPGQVYGASWSLNITEYDVIKRSH